MREKLQRLKDKKAIVLAVSLIVLAALLLLTSVYFFGIISEKRSVDTQRFILQAVNLAEAGTSHAQSELRERIRTDLKNRVALERRPTAFVPYIVNNDSLGFLRDFAHVDGDSQFVVAAGQAVLTISALDLNTAVNGNYSAKIIVKPDGRPTNPQSNVYIFSYLYSIESQGLVTKTTPSIGKNINWLQGKFKVTVRKDTFAKYALFTNHHTTTGGTAVWFTANTNFSGPTHTNDRFSFANNPSGNFNKEVTQGLSTARFYNNGYTITKNANSNPPYDVPVFQEGFSRGIPMINLPSSVTQQDLKNQATGGQNDSRWANGIYVPNLNNEVAGGIYIKGNADSLVMSVSHRNEPVYTISQGTCQKEISFNYTTNQTFVRNISGNCGTAPGTYSGIPNGTTHEGALVYANGAINNFSGKLQEETRATVASDKDIVISSHITYQDYNPGHPINAEGATNLLGILSWNGNIRIGTSAPNNLNIHGIVMAVGRSRVFTVDNYQSGSPRGTVTLLGGVISDFYGAFGTFSGTRQISGYGRNFIYDTRMLEGSTPPYFPYMTNFTSFDDGALDNKMVWQDKG